MLSGSQSGKRRRKRIRLDAENYARLGAICSVTIAVRDRQSVFAHPPLAQAAVEVLKQRAARTGVPVYAFCIMPDHVHLVLGPSSDCDIVSFIGQYKNLTLRATWEHGVQGSFWQKSFWDHFLRAEESLEQVISYVLGNPVRRGLVEDTGDYPYSGSLVFQI